MTEIFNVIVGTAGHIDHGKSSVVRKLTSIDPDRLKEEKERGLTIDLGFAPFVLPDKRQVGIIDVPGHEKFIKNMVAGASGIDFVLLVVASDDGIMPQTREHLEIMKLLDLNRGMVALTKIDLVDTDLVTLAIEELQEFLADTFLAGTPICPLSTVTGQGFEEFRQTFIRQIQSLSPHSAEGIFRMPIQRVFSSHGHGTVITGIPVSGQINIGDEVEILPQGNCGRIKKIQAYGQDVKCAQAGHSTALNVKDIDYKKIRRGQVIAAPGYLKGTRFIEAKFKYLEGFKRPLKHLTPVRFHTGTLEEIGKIAVLGQEAIEPGAEGYIQIRLESSVVTVPEDRFILRLSSPMITIGGGVIIGAGSNKLKRFRPKIISDLEQKENSLGDIQQKLKLLLLQAPNFILKEEELYLASLQEKHTFKDILQKLLKERHVVAISVNPPRYIHPDTIVRLEQQLLQIMHKFFEENPYKLRVACLQLRSLLPMDNTLQEFLLDQLKEQQKIEWVNNEVNIYGRTPALSPDELELTHKIEAIFKNANFAPPSLRELPELLGNLSREWLALVELLQEKNVLVKVAKDIYFHAAMIDTAKTLIVETIKQQGELVSADFRDKLQTTRKYVIPLLEYFDKAGITVRKGNARVLR